MSTETGVFILFLEIIHILFLGKKRKLEKRLELSTPSLRVKCSTD